MLSNILAHPFSYAIVAALGIVAGWFIQRKNPGQVAKALDELQKEYDLAKQKLSHYQK